MSPSSRFKVTGHYVTPDGEVLVWAARGDERVVATGPYERTRPHFGEDAFVSEEEDQERRNSGAMVSKTGRFKHGSKPEDKVAWRQYLKDLVAEQHFGA